MNKKIKVALKTFGCRMNMPPRFCAETLPGMLDAFLGRGGDLYG